MLFGVVICLVASMFRSPTTATVAFGYSGVSL